MPKVMRVEKQIWDVEGFAVVFLYEDGRDVRGDRLGLPGYSFQNAAKNSMSVADWKAKRFRSHYPGFDVAVLAGDGSRVHGGSLLATVRDSYIEDD